MRRSIVVVVLAVLIIGGVAVGIVVSDGGGTVDEALPECRSLPGRELGARAVDPSWNGCLTPDGAAVQAYGYECNGLREVIPPSGEEELVAEEAMIIVIPDAGLLGAEEQDWRLKDFSAAYLRTPFSMITPYRCAHLAALRHEGIAVAGCDLDETPVDLFTTQGCEFDSTYYRAIGRVCEYADFDTVTQWEQWWMDGRAVASGTAHLVIESRPDGRWALTPDDHRDDRCSTAPAEWKPSWGRIG